MFRKNKISKDTVSGKLGITDERADEIMSVCIEVIKDAKIKGMNKDMQEILKRANITDKIESVFAGYFYGRSLQRMLSLQNKLQALKGMLDL